MNSVPQSREDRVEKSIVEINQQLSTMSNTINSQFEIIKNLEKRLKKSSHCEN